MSTRNSHLRDRRPTESWTPEQQETYLAMVRRCRAGTDPVPAEPPPPRQPVIEFVSATLIGAVLALGVLLLLAAIGTALVVLGP